jgi:hypothetical protein
VVQHGDEQSYRLFHGDSEIGGLDIDGVQQLLANAGVSMADLLDVTDQLPERVTEGVA